MDLLSLNAAGLLAESRSELHRLLRAMELAGVGSYMSCYDTVARGLEQSGGSATVREVLAAADVTQLDAIAADLVTLERADHARAKIHQRVSEMFQLAGPDRLAAYGQFQMGVGAQDGPDRSGTLAVGHGAHTADPVAPVPIDRATYGAIRRAAPAPVFERLHEARQLGGGHYDGQRGEERFASDDLLSAHAGEDLLGGLRRNARAQSAQQQTATASRRLDAALERGKTPTERRRLLDGVVSEQLKLLDAEAANAKPSANGSDMLRNLVELRELRGSDPDFARFLDALIEEERGR